MTMPVELDSHAPAPPRRHRVVFWLAVLAALGAVAGGLFLAGTEYQEETAPERVVSDYLTALADGDAVAALALGDLPDGSADLLTDEVLEAQLKIAPMSDFAIDVVVAKEGLLAAAHITYSLGFDDRAQQVEDTIELVRTGRTWRLAEVAVPVLIRIVNGSSRASFVGADVPDGVHLLFPGALPVEFDTENLALDEETRVIEFDADGDHEEVAEVSAAGQAAVGAALDAALEACLTGTAELPTLCPLPSDARAVPGSLRGSLAEPASEIVAIRTQAGNDGLVRISGEITVTGQYEQLDFNNQRVVITDDLTIELLAVCFATTPESIIWRAT